MNQLTTNQYEAAPEMGRIKKMKKLTVKIQGVEPLLMNNPRTVDPFDSYAKAKKKITDKRVKTEEDLLELRRLDVESKVYLDPELGVYLPSTWVSASIAGNSWAKVKIKKADIRSCVFPSEGRIKLHYAGEELVRTLQDISGNPRFITTMLLKQGQVKVPKAAPIFHNWWFETEIEFDQSMIDEESIITLLKHGAMYSGYGDFRPTFGRAKASCGKAESVKEVA